MISLISYLLFIPFMDTSDLFSLIDTASIGLDRLTATVLWNNSQLPMYTESSEILGTLLCEKLSTQALVLLKSIAVGREILQQG
jgi:hypothetical protein